MDNLSYMSELKLDAKYQNVVNLPLTPTDVWLLDYKNTLKILSVSGFVCKAVDLLESGN